MKFKGSLLLLLLIPHLLISQGRRTGYYYNSDQEKIEGEIKLKGNYLGGGSKLVMYLPNGQKQKLSPEEIKSFVMGTDSFAVVKGFSAGGASYFDADYALVLDTGKINLYEHESKVIRSRNDFMGGTNASFEQRTVLVINERGSKRYYGMYNRSQVEKYLLPLIKDAELRSKIEALKNRELHYELSFLIRQYNDL